MRVNNYFKLMGVSFDAFFPFDDASIDTVREAWASARRVSDEYEKARSKIAHDVRAARIAVWNPPRIAGPWGELPRVGDWVGDDVYAAVV